MEFNLIVHTMQSNCWFKSFLFHGAFASVAHVASLALAQIYQLQPFPEQHTREQSQQQVVKRQAHTKVNEMQNRPTQTCFECLASKWSIKGQKDSFEDAQQQAPPTLPAYKPATL